VETKTRNKFVLIKPNDGIKV